MPLLRDAAKDLALEDINNGVRMDICVTEPTTYGQATTIDTHSLGFKAGLVVPIPEAGLIDGRRVIVPAFIDGTVTGTGTQTAGFWALTDGVSILYATGSLAASQSVTNGNTFSLDATSVTIRAATSV